MPPSAAGSALLDAFGQIVVINLPERADRRRAMAQELSRLGLSFDHPRVHLFPGIRPSDAGGFPSIGARGAFASHKAVMEMIRDRGWDRALVLEDDMKLAPDAPRRLRQLAQALETTRWHVVYGHAGTPRPDPADNTPDALIPLQPGQALIQLHFLGLTREAVAIILPELEAMLKRPPGSPLGGPMHVDGALNWIRAAHPDLVALAPRTPLALQRSSRSDIAGPRWFDRVPGLAPVAAFARRLRG